jgi:glycosyltransferase involved in cell wall biosynthesis
MEEQDIMVTIRCATYNHEPYIRQCLEGFVMQKTNFRYIAIIHDDASTDKTTEIIREYAEKYPNIIRPIFQKENQYSKGRSYKIREMLDELVTSKYTAMCEGDDFWTDENKLQKQFDWMESHPDYSACFHQALVHYEDGSHPDKKAADIQDRDYCGIELLNEDNRPPTASLFMRSDVCKSNPYKIILNQNLSFFDIPLFLSCAHAGKVRGMSDVMSVYRKQSSGMTNSFITGGKGMIKIADDFLKIYKVFGNKYKIDCINIHVNLHINYFFLNLQKGHFYPKEILKPLFRYPIPTASLLWERWKAHKNKK